ncbi:MAG TPA: CHAD domain-containing protein [Urbifossiella sp.]
MPDGKWIDGLHPEMPIAEAARLVLAARFSVVQEHLAPAAETPYADREYVHQLRVGTRRAKAALEVFRDDLSKKVQKKAKAVLRTIRKAAGTARDWDVFVESLESARPLQDAAGKPTLDFLLGYALGERSAAQAELVDAFEEVNSQLLELGPAITEHIREPHDKSFGELAEDQLHLDMDEFHRAVEADPHEPAELHKLRILGKHLRYSIEIFAPCFDASLKEHLYPAVEALQEQLGELQDAVVGIERLEGLRSMAQQMISQEWPRIRQGFTKLLQGLRTKLRTGQKRFQTWKKNWERLIREYPLELVKEHQKTGEPAA